MRRQSLLLDKALLHSTDLFRPEAVAHRLQRKQEETLLLGSKWLTPLAWCIAVLLLGLVAMMNSTQYKETESARGRILPTVAEQKLVSPKSGVVNNLQVEFGERVKKGEIVAVISLDLFNARGEVSNASAKQMARSGLANLASQKALKLQQFELRQSYLMQQSRQLEARQETALDSLATAREQVLLSEEMLAVSDTLLAKRVVTQSQFDRQKISHLNLLSKSQAAEQTHQELLLQSQHVIENLKVTELEIELELSRIQQEKEALLFQLRRLQDENQISVLAQQDGYVAMISVAVGDAVTTGQPLVYLQSEATGLLAELYVPSRVVAKLAPGQELMLRYDAFDYKSYGRYLAVISEISRAAMDPREHLLPVGNLSEPVFRVLVHPEQHYVEGSEVYPLQAGLLLSADFIVAEMSLLGFIFQPVLNLRGKVS